MRTIRIALMCLLLALRAITLSGQSNQNLDWNIPTWEPGIGMVFQHEEKFSAARISLGARNLLLKNRLGFYYVLEYRGNIQFQEDITDFYFRDLLGTNYSLNRSFSVHAALGVFRKGILLNGDLRGGEFYWANLQYGRLRKEIGITYTLPTYPVSFAFSYSNWVGPTATFAYFIPIKQKKPTIQSNRDTVTVINRDTITVINRDTITVINRDTITVFNRVTVMNDDDSLVRAAKIAEKIIVAEILKQSNVYFALNSDYLDTINKAKMFKLIEYLKTHLDAKLIVYGSADKRGSDEYNLLLSAARAKNVRTYLIEQGISETRIDFAAYGEQKSKSETEEEQTLDRCVEFEIQFN
jgi:outer membrane protein OmpA-like peptidoglycan-associated protein